MATQTHKGMIHLICLVLESYAVGRRGRADEEIIVDDPDCKLALNHMIRHYGLFFIHPEPEFWSVDALSETDRNQRTRDHVIPVAEIMKVLMRKATEQNGVSQGFLVDFLGKYLVTCRITKSEDRRLTKAGFAEAVPPQAILPYDEFDIWARYDHLDCKIQRQNTDPWIRKTKGGKSVRIKKPEMNV